ncbi:MAG: acyltransferase [Proteobacteria bacterium]|nr:MAG: acyltransferase [Pseudomonadota bacterium]
MQYRKELDGLRAVAVLPVMWYHAKLPWLTGGFTGVDIFFVISGYLITSILLSELQQERLSLLHFYERRARRILPALFWVLLVCLPFAWWLLLPHELAGFGRSLVAVAVFVSNLLFWQESDYFSPDADLMPLLHTWSLAVEEQYYLLFPLLLALGWKLGKGKARWIALGITLIALSSFMLSECLWRASQAANFYLLPSRAWELMLGALTALYLRYRSQPSGWLGQVGSLLGLAMIILGIFWLHTGLPFPGVYALLPTVGSVLIILFAAPSNGIGRLLAWPPLVWIGLVSYSAYLWHQPLLVFSRIYWLDEPASGWRILILVLTLLLAWLSWRFIEQPIRQRQRFSRRFIFTLAIVGSLIFIGIGGGLVVGKGFPGRFY